ncbi:hypothetical protein [Polaromonas sp.]|jgi:hypothetical protein|uniref:hypothetical protein n=1 Tax=Polaromonas sp. TaxID=1869339 RepID=UPI0037CBD3CB
MNFEGFMYIDVENPLVAWNVYRGVLVSQKLVQLSTGDTPTQAFSMNVAKIFMDRDWSRLTFEYELEAVRASEFSACVSRLHCIFVFSDADSALAAARDASWGGHINEEFLTDVGVSAAPSYTRVDANWVSWMLQAQQRGDVEWRDGIRLYWSGHACPHFPQPIWEVLLDGAVTIWGTALRQRAYEVTKQRSPASVCMLEQSRLAASLGSDLGHISAFLTTENGKQLLSFYIDMRDAHNRAYTDRLAAYMAANPDRVNYGDLAIGGDHFAMPNFILYSYVFGS